MSKKGSNIVTSSWQDKLRRFEIILERLSELKSNQRYFNIQSKTTEALINFSASIYQDPMYQIISCFLLELIPYFSIIIIHFLQLLLSLYLDILN